MNPQSNITKTIHLQRTSEANEVPALWAVAELTRQIKRAPAALQAQVMYHGWRDGKLTYEQPRSSLEMAEARMEAVLAQVRRLTERGATAQQMQALAEDVATQLAEIKRLAEAAAAAASVAAEQAPDSLPTE